MPKKAAILQSNYIPWKGYFDLINQVDTFILYDDMQYTTRDWRNRNLIQSSQGRQWLTIPVQVKGKRFQKISETLVSQENWGKKHWQALTVNYNKAPYFAKYKAIFEPLYLAPKSPYLSQINASFIQAINQILGIETPILWSSQFKVTGDKSERLLHLCQAVEATNYLSGPAAKDYLDEDLFKTQNIQVSWMDYQNYPIYNQLHSPFQHQVSILDLIFNEGTNAPHFMKSF